ncbi:TasA family protein [Blastococcus sp. URHD0036]|uniref:TasA family protein n=1 Tax=Blastococcus sp. URHD0036 TaxID=1380356 RepID=UPI0004950104|nr:TasA family protein [Blastococcus sp. URHD0036]
MSARTRKATSRKVIGSLGVLGAAAAVAGLGTFGTFTDSTTPISTAVASGTVNIDLSTPGAAIPATTGNFVPGDSMTRAVTLVNSGTSALSSVTLGTTATVSSVLNTDANGLQLNVKSCTVPWTQGGTATAPTYTCGGTVTDFGTTAAVSNRTLAGLKSLNPVDAAVPGSGTDYLTFTISLPTTAGDNLQGKSSTLSLVFTGTQRAASAR